MKCHFKSSVVVGFVLMTTTSAFASYNFINVTRSAGVADFGRSHFGATFVDYDQDGWLDILSVNGDGDPGEIEDINTLFQNNHDGTFTNVTRRTGTGDRFVAMRNIWADYDRDGDTDLYSHNFVQSTLYQNNNNIFTDVNETSGAGLTLSNGTGAAWADFDRDGWIDLHAVGFPQGLNILLHNNGDGTFTNIQPGSGLNQEANGMGNAVADYNNDGLPDIATAAVTTLDDVFLYEQNLDGSFTNTTAEAGIVVETGSSTSAVFWFDYDNDGHLDMFLNEVALGSQKTEPVRVYLFRNMGDGTFSDTTLAAGIDTPESATSFWDAAFADYDSDGDVDLYLGVTNASNQFYQNNGDGTFSEIAATIGVDLVEEGKGITWGDYDNDGDMDMYVSQRARSGVAVPNVLLQNTGGINGWLQIELEGLCSNLDAIGARLTLTSRDGHNQIREINGGTGLFSQHSPIQHFGLGVGANNHPQRLTILWPNGFVQTVNRQQLVKNSRIFIRESVACRRP